MTDRIDLKGIEVYAKHGVLEHEQTQAQIFRVDVSVFLDLAKPGETDELAHTLDYGELALEVREIVGTESHALIERVAASVADAVMAHEDVERTIVTIHKPEAPVDAVVEDIAVTIERSR